MSGLNHDLIREASEFLRGRVRRTPLEPSPELTAALGAPVWLKLECLQITGSFKLRGALFRLSKLTPDERRCGVVTCSAGNHGKGIAYASRELGIRSIIYVPKLVDESKYRGMLALGADVRRSEFPGYDDTEVWAREQAAQDGMPFVSAFDDPAVMAANGGSLALEILEDLPQARTFVLPVGGGGLGAGLAYVVRDRIPGARLVGCQLAASPALALSLERGQAVTRLPAVDSLAGGVEGGIGAMTFPILQDRISQVVLVSEQAVHDGVLWMLDRHQYLIEPTAAVPIAACLGGEVTPADGPVVVVISGRNVSLATLGKLVAGGASG